MVWKGQEAGKQFLSHTITWWLKRSGRYLSVLVWIQAHSCMHALFYLTLSFPHLHGTKHPQVIFGWMSSRRWNTTCYTQTLAMDSKRYFVFLMPAKCSVARWRNADHLWLVFFSHPRPLSHPVNTVLNDIYTESHPFSLFFLGPSRISLLASPLQQWPIGQIGCS